MREMAQEYFHRCLYQGTFPEGSTHRLWSSRRVLGFSLLSRTRHWPWATNTQLLRHACCSSQGSNKVSGGNIVPLQSLEVLAI